MLQLLQNRINELNSAIINQVDDRVHVIGFYNEKMLIRYLNTNIDNRKSIGLYPVEEIDYSSIRDNALFIIQKNGEEIRRLQYKQIFKQNLKSLHTPQNLVVTVRKNLYGDDYTLLVGQSITAFENLDELNKHLLSHFRMKDLIEE